MAYRGLTAIGANYLATRLAQELPVEITRVQIGAGTPIGNPGDVSELQNYKLDAKILKKSQENNTLEITIQVVNEDVDQGFYLKEIGVFVNDDTEKLYWYCNEDNAQYIPAKTDSAIAFEIDIKMEVTNIESPIMNWSGKGTWIDKDYLEEVLKNHVVNNLTEQSATKALAANQGVVLDNKDVGIMGGRDGKFPLTAATKGNIYLLESTQKYYICINDYDGIQISVPNANFEELSVYTNRSKLDNLSINGSSENIIFFTAPFDNTNSKPSLSYLKSWKCYYIIATSSSLSGTGILLPITDDSWRATLIHKTTAVTLNVVWSKDGFRLYGNDDNIMSISIKEILIM